MKYRSIDYLSVKITMYLISHWFHGSSIFEKMVLGKMDLGEINEVKWLVMKIDLRNYSTTIHPVIKAL